MRNSIYDFEQLKKFIKENNIKTRSELSRKFTRIYGDSFLPLTEKERDLLLPSTYPSYEHLNTKEDFKQFFEENNVIGRGDLSHRFKSCYSRFMKILTKTERAEILPSLVLQDYTHLKTKDDFKQFIEENNIKSRKDLNDSFYKASIRFKEFLTEEERDELLPPLRKDFSNLIDYEDFKRFIEENNILSRKDFGVRFYSGYAKFRNLLTNKEKDSLLPTIKSLGEKSLHKLFEDNLIIYETEKTYNDLRGDSDVSLRYDFYLPEYNTLVEYHGSQHFNPNTKYYTERGIELDHIKYEYAKRNGINLLYFTSEIYTYNRFGYFTEVITDSDILIQKIKEIKISLTN